MEKNDEELIIGLGIENKLREIKSLKVFLIIGIYCINCIVLYIYVYIKLILKVVSECDCR